MARSLTRDLARSLARERVHGGRHVDAAAQVGGGERWAVHLPDLDGWDVFSQLQVEEATRKIPVIVLSADATARQIQQFMTAGARDYLTKPLDVARFSRVIEESAWPSTDSKTLIQKPNGKDNELIKKADPPK